MVSCGLSLSTLKLTAMFISGDMLVMVVPQTVNTSAPLLLSFRGARSRWCLPEFLFDIRYTLYTEYSHILQNLVAAVEAFCESFFLLYSVCIRPNELLFFNHGWLLHKARKCSQFSHGQT